MPKFRNNTYYLAAIALFILLKFWMGTFDNNQMIFLLGPVNQIFGFIAGSDSIYSATNGFYHEGFNIVIDKSCSGYNFLLLCFLLLYFLVVKYMKRESMKWMMLPGALGLAFILTVFINASRILISSAIQQKLLTYLELDSGIIHESIGVVTNLSFLIIIYLVVEKLLIRKYAKLT